MKVQYSLIFSIIFGITGVLQPTYAQPKPKCSDLPPLNYPPIPLPFAEANPGQVTKHYKHEVAIASNTACSMSHFDGVSCRFVSPIDDSQYRTCLRFLTDGKNKILSSDMKYYSEATRKAIADYEDLKWAFDKKCLALSYQISPKGACVTTYEAKPCVASTVKLEGDKCIADVTCVERWSCNPKTVATGGGGLEY